MSYGVTPDVVITAGKALLSLAGVLLPIIVSLL